MSITFWDSPNLFKHPSFILLPVLTLAACVCPRAVSMSMPIYNENLSNVDLSPELIYITPMRLFITDTLLETVSGCPEQTVARRGSSAFCISKSSEAERERVEPPEHNERVCGGHPDTSAHPDVKSGFIKKTFRGINKNIVAISLVSFFNDISSEMVYPVVPIFLVTVLNAPMTIVGLIEGIAESTANMLRVFSGYFSDRSGRRKAFMTGGYILSALSKLVIAMASGWALVMGGRFLDRFGKGVRTSARDALLAGVSEERHRGKVFGFHRALDTLGAMIGPLTVFLLLKVFENNLRLIFYLAFIPAAAGVVLLTAFVRDVKSTHGTRKRPIWRLRDVKLSGDFKVFLLASTVFALGNSSDAFIILRAHSLGFTLGTTILAYALFNIVYAVFSFPAGIISDSIGQKKVLLWGFALFALIYFLFGITNRPAFLWALFPLYGIYMALTEGIGKAYISLHAKGEFAGTTYGIYQTVTGLATFPASLAAGFLWKYVSPGAPFFFGAAMALVALITFAMARKEITENCA